MSEAPQFSREPHLPVTLEHLDAIMQSEAWQNLAPNNPRSDDLDPRSLWPSQVEQVIKAMQTPAITRGFLELRERFSAWDHAPDELRVPSVGTLEKVGFGETRICYKLTARNGQVMAVTHGGYGGALGLKVPEHPNFTLVNTTWDSRLWEYSDLRTYLCVPTGRSTGIMLREYGGASNPYMLGFHAREIARRRVFKRIEGIDTIRPDLTLHELAKDRHYLFKPGSDLAAVIDIPIEERIF